MNLEQTRDKIATQLMYLSDSKEADQWKICEHHADIIVEDFIKPLVEALKFYANPENYEQPEVGKCRTIKGLNGSVDCILIPYVMYDYGVLARETLEKLEV